MYLKNHKFKNFQVEEFLYPIYFGVISMEYDTKKLIDFVYKVKKGVKLGVIKSNTQNSYQTHKLNVIEDLIEFSNKLQEFLSEHMCVQVNNFEFWANINSLGGANNVHTHISRNDAESLQKNMSGVYYLKVNEKSGNIGFLNPIYLNEQTFYIPKEKDLIIFPSYVPHFVEPNLNSEDRITIAFNFKIG